MFGTKRPVVTMALLALWFPPFDAYCKAASATVTVRIALEKQTVTEHEPVVIDIRLQSPATASADFDPGYGWENVRVKVRCPDGQQQEHLPVARREGMTFSTAIHLDPGTERTISFVANDWFRFEKQGLYEIQFLLRKTSGVPSDTSATLRLQVQPRDEVALKVACAALLARVNDSRSYQASLVAAKALADVNDVVVVPYLAAVMKKREFASLMIASLSRLKTPEAVAALQSASHSDDPETRSLAHSALVALGVADN